MGADDLGHGYGMGRVVCPCQASMAQPRADGSHHLAQVGGCTLLVPLLILQQKPVYAER